MKGLVALRRLEQKLSTQNFSIFGKKDFVNAQRRSKWSGRNKYITQYRMDLKHYPARTLGLGPLALPHLAPAAHWRTSNAAKIPLNAQAVHIVAQASNIFRRFDSRLDRLKFCGIDFRLDVPCDGSARTTLTVERPLGFSLRHRIHQTDST